MSRWLPRFALPAAVAVAALFTLAPTAALAANNNGAVKIQSNDVDSIDNADSANDPQIACPFSVSFTGFDSPTQKVRLEFTMHAPTGNDEELLTDTETFDGAATFNYAGSDLKDLDTFTSGPLGYHVKLTIFTYDGEVSTEYKHKVFWLKCDPATPTPTPTTPTPTTPDPTTPTDPGTTTPPPGGGNLPLTGTAVGGIVVTGIGLVAGGAVLMLARRRRDATDAS